MMDKFEIGFLIHQSGNLAPVVDRGFTPGYNGKPLVKVWWLLGDTYLTNGWWYKSDLELCCY